MTATYLAPPTEDREPLQQPEAVSKRRIGWMVAASLAMGLVVALLLALAPFVPAEEGKVTGALLVGFAIGWSMLVILSGRFTDQPQRWALVPALFMGMGGVLLLAFGSPAQGILKWLWPPALLVLVVWMYTRSRRQLRRGSRWLLYPIFGLLLITGLGGTYEMASAAVDKADYPMTGVLVDVGGHRLHLRCSGSGNPTVVLEPGAGEMSSGMAWVEAAVGGDTRVCVYDRAGRGWSEPADAPQDANEIAADLHTLLDRAGESGPYVLAGHSFGGLYVLAFAAQYPDEVAGMVLVDSTAPAATTSQGTPGDSNSYDLSGRVSAMLSSTARLGVGRLLGQSDYGDLPSQSRDEARASFTTVGHLKGTIEEYLTANASMAQAATLTDLGDKALVVLTAGSGSSEDWIADQDDLATLSLNSSHRVIEGATHASLIHHEEHAAETSQAILDVVSSVRNEAQLAGDSG